MTDPTPQTETAEQELGGHFPNAIMPLQPFWNGATPPTLGAKEGIVLFPDAGGSYWNALIADTGQGKITYAVKLTPSQLGAFLGKAGAGSNYPRIDIIRVPPAPPPGGSDWLARFGLEIELDVSTIAQRAYSLSK
ncbi:hypothetical protein BH11MYX3_BH11MYX3_39730 [soil metagenome]